MKKGRVTHLFPGSNTPVGFYSFYQEGLAGLDRIFILKGGPGTGKSTLIRKLATDMTERGYDVELWQCSSDNDSLDGVIVPALSLAMVDGTFPHVVDPQYPGAVEEIINLGDHWDRGYLVARREQIKTLGQEKKDCFAAAYQTLAALRQELDAAEGALPPLEAGTLAKAAEDLLQTIFCTHKPRLRRFFGAAITPRGHVGYIEELTADCSRYLLQGRELAVSTVLAQVAASAGEKGHRVNLYYNALAPQQVEALLLPGLQLALVSAQMPSLLPRETDVRVVLPGGSSPENLLFQQELEQSCRELLKAKSTHQELEKIYLQAMDFEGVDDVATKIFNDILSLTVQQKR